MSSESSADLFSIERVDSWRLPGLRATGIRLVTSGGGVLGIVTSDGTLLRWDTDESRAPARGDSDNTDDGGSRAPAPDVVDFARGARPEGSRIAAVFIDSTGSHMLASVVSAGAGQTFYCGFSASAAAAGARPSMKELPGLRGHIVESVAWRPGGVVSATATGPFLVGTSAGRILLAAVEDRREKEVTRLWDVGGASASGGGGVSGGALGAIAALRWDAPGAVLVLMRGPPRWLEFVAAGSGGGVKEAFASPPMARAEGTDSPSIASVCGAHISLLPGVDGAPPAYALLTAGGLSMGELATARARVGSLVSSPKPAVLAYPPFRSGGATDGGAPTAAPTPVSVALTAHHALLLFRARLMAVSRIVPATGDASPPHVSWESALPEERAGVMRALLIDSALMSGASVLRPAAPGAALVALAYSDKHLFRIIASNEGRDAWRLHLSRGDFDSARIAAAESPAALEAVLTAEADALLASGRAEQAAETLAKSSRPFEATCLRFLEGGHRDGLRRYLEERWERLRPLGAAVAPQRAVLCAWILELHLDGLSGSSGGTLEERVRSDSRKTKIRDFLRKAAVAGSGGGSGSSRALTADLDRATALTLFASHGNTASTLFYLRLCGEWSRVVAHHIARAEWQDAVDAIKEAPPSAAKAVGKKKGAQADVDDAGEGGSDGGGDEDDDDDDKNEDAEKESDDGLDEDDNDDDADGGASKSGDSDTGVDSVGRASPPSGSPNSRQELWYAHSAVLLPQLPSAVIAGWKSCPALDATRLIPTLVRFASARARAAPLPQTVLTTPVSMTDTDAIAKTLNAALLYIEWVVRRGLARGKRARPLYNLLVVLYAALPLPPADGSGVRDEGPLLSFVERSLEHLPPAPPSGGAVRASVSALVGDDAAPSAAVLESLAVVNDGGAGKGGGDGGNGSRQDRGGAPFDIDFALRVALSSNRPRTTVRLMCALGLYAEAVDIALAAGDVELAKRAAASPPPPGRGITDSDALSLAKRLWLRVAVHVITRAGADVAGGDAPSAAAAAALLLLQESGVLRIEDVLPYLPSSTRLEDFKTAVSASLADADAVIQKLRGEMREYTASAERLRNDARALHRRCTTVRVSAPCDACSTPVLARPMYAFPCGHAFHTDCLTARVAVSATSGVARRISNLQALIARAHAAAGALAAGGVAALGGLAADLWALLPPTQPRVAGADAGVAVGATQQPPNGASHPLIESRATAVEVRSKLVARADAAQADLDALVSGQCLLCGEAIIASIFEKLDIGNRDAETDWSV